MELTFLWSSSHTNSRVCESENDKKKEWMKRAKRRIYDGKEKKERKKKHYKISINKIKNLLKREKKRKSCKREERR